MESFGILQFLQSMLSSAPNPPTTESEKPPTAEAQAERAASETAPPVEKETHSQAAILQYMEAHDKRARKLKK